MALTQKFPGKHTTLALALGITGAAFFYGDAILTPAISVLSAVEGLKLLTPVFEPYVVPITLGILIGLFLIQSHGTGKVAVYFGPVTLVWFLAMAACAVPHLLHYPQIFYAFSPVYGAQFLLEHRLAGVFVLGAVFLAVTGAEALYADMGHFGRRPIKFTWMAIVFPALVMNYLGQGAMILHRPETLENPFFLLAPSWALLPMVLLAAAATVIASQAVITGAYSLTRQAMQLGMLPRMEIRHTSGTHAGQIYLPQVNRLLLVGVVILVLEFKSSGNLAAAYGIAVSGTMLMTSLLAFLVVWKVWKKPLWMALAIAAPFVCVDTTFILANLLKLFDGGYVPVLLGVCAMVVMWTWMRGSRFLAAEARKYSIPVRDLVPMLEEALPARVSGTAMFLTSEPDVVPTAFMHNLKHNKVLHEANFILTIRTAPSPYVQESERVAVERISSSLSQLTMHFGYMETPNVMKALLVCRKQGLQFDIMGTSFFFARRNIKSSPAYGLPAWQDRIYIFLARNATNATEFFRIPPGCIVELGTQVTI